MNHQIVFFFPWREVSGGPFYLSGLANDLAADGRYQVWYVDYEDGPGQARLSHQRVRIIRYTEPFTFPLAEPVTLITPMYCAPHIPRLHPQSRLLFLNWHNYSTQELRNLWRLSDRQLRHFLEMLLRRDALFFLDRTHWQAQNEWLPPGTPFPERYVPVKLPPSSVRAVPRLVHPPELHVTVLGRLCTDKIFSVLNLLEQLERLGGDIRVSLIGSGPESSRIRERCWGNGLRVHMEGTITGVPLQRFLAERTDVLFAMGMSVLEGARIGLPCVIIPHNIQPIHVDAYAYLQDSRGYAVGWYDTQIPQMGIPMHTLAEILAGIRQKDGKRRLGQEALAYWERNHSSNVDAFKAQLGCSGLSYAEFSRFSSRHGWIRAFGIPLARLELSFDGRQKRVSLFGSGRLLQYRVSDGSKAFYLFGRPCRWIHGKNENGWFRFYVGPLRIPFLKL